MTNDEFKAAIAQPLREVIAEKHAAEDELRAYQSIISFLTGSDPEVLAALLEKAGKALGGREAEIAAHYIVRARKPEVRRDIGGWISGPCLTDPDAQIEVRPDGLYIDGQLIEQTRI